VPPCSAPRDDNSSTPSAWPADWAERVRGENCALCAVVGGRAPGSWRVVGRGRCVEVHTDLRAIPGYCVVLWSRDHRAEPTDLSTAEASLFWQEVLAVGRAVDEVFEPVKLNYLVLGNAVPHLHAQIVPRHRDDPAPAEPLPFDRIFGADGADPGGRERSTAELRDAVARHLGDHPR
jgi:diadenosine tetraphosphate (Ap4A) HIT family hydrolase